VREREREREERECVREQLRDDCIKESPQINFEKIIVFFFGDFLIGPEPRRALTDSFSGRIRCGTRMVARVATVWNWELGAGIYDQDPILSRASCAPRGYDAVWGGPRLVFW
jgi:hypothetical protein